MKTTVVLSRHFALDELTKSNTANRLKIKNQSVISVYEVNNLQKLCRCLLDNIKSMFPDMKINSGWRCHALNKAVGGNINSQHIDGQAADITCKNINDLWKYINLLEFDQAILYDNFIHISYLGHGLNRNQYIDKTTKKQKGGKNDK